MDINSSEKMYMESVYQALDQKLKIASDSVRGKPPTAYNKRKSNDRCAFPTGSNFNCKGQINIGKALQENSKTNFGVRIY